MSNTIEKNGCSRALIAFTNRDSTLTRVCGFPTLHEEIPDKEILTEKSATGIGKILDTIANVFKSLWEKIKELFAKIGNLFGFKSRKLKNNAAKLDFDHLANGTKTVSDKVYAVGKLGQEGQKAIAAIRKYKQSD